MNPLSTPVLSADLLAYVADLAARVDRLEQRTTQQRFGEPRHNKPHSHFGMNGSHPYHIGPCSHPPHPHYL